MNQIFEILSQSQRANQLALDMEGRAMYPTLGIVVNNQDPENRRRVKVTTANNPGLESRWLTRLVDCPYIDYPVPNIGQTVLVFYIEGLDTQGCYISLLNDTNPTYSTESPLQDQKQEIPGNRYQTVLGDNSEEISGNNTQSVDGDVNLTTEGAKEERVEGAINISGGSTITITNDSGASITLGNGGQVIVTDSAGRSLRLGGSVSNDNVWDLNGFPLKLINATSFTVNGSELATVGAVDNRGDVLVDRGW